MDTISAAKASGIFLGLDFTIVGRAGGGNLTAIFQRVETCPARVEL